MSDLLHHLAAIGWGWVALFATLDILAVGSAVLAVAGRRRRRALWAVLLCTCAAFASLVATALVATAGLSVADTVEGTGSAATERAKGLAQGISVTMNGTALGLLSTFLVGLAGAVCLVTAILYRSKPTPSRSARRDPL